MYLLHFCNEDMELFLCFDEASVNSTSDTATTSQQRMGIDVDGSLARDLLCLPYSCIFRISYSLNNHDSGISTVRVVSYHPDSFGLL